MTKRTYGSFNTNLFLSNKAKDYYNGTDPMSIYEYEDDAGNLTYTYRIGSDPESRPMTDTQLNKELEAMWEEENGQEIGEYYIVTDLESKPYPFDTMKEAVEFAEREVPRQMNWEVRDENGDVVYTHYIEEDEDDAPAEKIWYAVMKGNEDNDWGTGSYDRDEAVNMARANKDIYPDGYVAVIEETDTGSVCIGEIRNLWPA